MNPDIIFTRNLSFGYGSLKVLHDLNLRVMSGSIYGFLGPNGAGKTTTIKALLGLLRVHHGMIFLFNQDIRDYQMNLKAKTGSTVETPSVYQHLTGKENIEIVRILRKLPRSETSRVLKLSGLLDQAERPAGQYSTGMKQRMALAVALLGQPELLVLDEPMNGLDPSGIAEIREFLRDINKQYGTTILLSSHILGEIEKLATNIGIIDNGKLKFQGTQDELQKQLRKSNLVCIVTGNNELACRLLMGASKQVEVGKESILLQAENRLEIARTVKWLVENGVDVFQVTEQKSDLEQLFLNLLNKQV